MKQRVRMEYCKVKEGQEEKIGEEEIRRALKKIKDKKAIGEDEISMEI